MGKMPSFSNFVNGKWQVIAPGTLVEIENGAGSFSGQLARIASAPYGGKETDRNFPPIYNIYVRDPVYGTMMAGSRTPEEQGDAPHHMIETNFMADRLLVVEETKWACEHGEYQFCGDAPSRYCLVCLNYFCLQHHCKHLKYYATLRGFPNV